jgi:predicted RNA binding protein YcfA (HicA-like mRNA interferase family)
MPMSGKEMLRLFEKNGWKKIRQKGSHVVVQKDGELPETIPMHKELKKGLEKTLMKRLKR